MTGTYNPSLPGSRDIVRHCLKNGIVLLIRENFNSPSIAVRGMLPVGSLNDQDNKLGLSYFTAASLMRGTKQANFQEIYHQIESIGASLSFNSGTHTTSFGIHALAEDLPLMLKLMSESLRSPVFPVDQINRLKAQMLTMLAIRAQDTGQMASLIFDQLLYKGHPYERPDEGTVETVSNINVDDLKEFHASYYAPQAMMMTITGAVKAEDAIKHVEACLGDWENPHQLPQPALPVLAPLQQPVRQDFHIPGKVQADLVVGVVGPLRTSADYYACAIGNNIFGQFGMMGRIGERVREQAGLAYYAHSELTAGQGPGSWTVTAGVNPENLEKALGLIQDEFKRFVDEPVTDEELDDSKSFIIGRLPLSLETNTGVAYALLTIERFNLGLDYLQNYAETMREITPQVILAAARQYINPDCMAVAVAGP